MNIYKYIHENNFHLKQAAEILFLYFKESKVATRPAQPSDFSTSCLILFDLDENNNTNRADSFGAWTNNGGLARQTVAYNLNVTRNLKNFSCQVLKEICMGMQFIILMYIKEFPM